MDPMSGGLSNIWALIIWWKWPYVSGWLSITRRHCPNRNPPTLKEWNKTRGAAIFFYDHATWKENWRESELKYSRYCSSKTLVFNKAVSGYMYTYSCLYYHNITYSFRVHTSWCEVTRVFNTLSICCKAISGNMMCCNQHRDYRADATMQHKCEIWDAAIVVLVICAKSIMQYKYKKHRQALTGIAIEEVRHRSMCMTYLGSHCKGQSIKAQVVIVSQVPF